ncbi:MAG TPA: SusC/RagA family TonB-linked outer membrane protein [Gemmatimonadaceae bacterium]|jgi:TonB-linked SusC/RagA family outer membrane protein
MRLAALVSLLLTTIPTLSAAPQATGVVSGVVLAHQSLRPLAGAQVGVVGTRLGALSDANGRFRLAGVEGDSVSLDVRLIGFQPAKLVARVGDANVRVLLSEVAVSLDQVVVTGTAGVTEQRAMGNLLEKVQTEDVVRTAPVVTPQQLLEGRVAGLVVLPGSGNIGTGSTMHIRGVASLSLTNQPLIYVDGVRVDNSASGGPSIRDGAQVARINDINPEDIESMEVIKGPAAATLYGTEASSGVIQIITKRGHAGVETYDFAMQQGTSWLADLGQKVPTLWGVDSTGALTSVNLYEKEKAAGRDPFQTGTIQGYTARMNGGTDAARYYVSGAYDRSTGIESYNWQDKYSGRTNLNLMRSEKVQVSADLGYTHTLTRLGQSATGWDLWSNIVWGSPARLNTATRGFLRAPPEASSQIESMEDIQRVTGSLQLLNKPTRWFSHRLTIGTDAANSISSVLFPRDPAGAAYFFGTLSLGQKTEDRLTTTFNTIDYSATATASLPFALASASSFGFQDYSKRYASAEAVGKSFPSPSVTSIGGAAITTSTEDLIENKTVGFYVQEQVSRANRLFLTAALRGDNNSAFGANFKHALYPKFSGSWVANEEPFWHWTSVNALRIRAAYGKAGKQPDVFAAQRLYQPATGPGDAAVITPLAIGNPDLRPEVSSEVELGFDLGAFDDRIGVNFTYYDQMARDAIVQRQVEPSLGFPGFQYVNGGRVANHGTELSLDTHPIRRRRLDWAIGGQIATNNNRVVTLGGLPPISLGSSQFDRVGYPVAGFFAKRVISAQLDQTGKPSNLICAGDASTNNQSVPCASAPLVYWGTPTARWTGNVSSSVTLWRSLRLYGLVDFRGGQTINDGDVSAAHTAFRNSKAINEKTDPILMAYDQLGTIDQLGFFKAGFAKLRELSATYTLSGRPLQRLGASGASISIAGRNLATLWRAQKDIFGEIIADPEIGIPSSELSNYVQSVVPPLAQFVATFRLTF